jgi:hypothetical protein
MAGGKGRADDLSDDGGDVPDDIDHVLWSLCMSGEGDIIRNPNEVLHEWTLEQVLDALELKQIRGKIVEARRASQAALRNSRK